MNDIHIHTLELALLLLFALIGDTMAYKIKNQVTFPFILLGMATNFRNHGWAGLKLSFLGSILPVVLLSILYLLRMLGAGDIKLFSAIGAIMGAEFVLYSMAYAFLTGGVIAAALLLLRRNGKQRMSYLFNYLKTCFLTLSIQPYADFQDKNDGAKFPFAWAITCGASLQLLLDTLPVLSR